MCPRHWRRVPRAIQAEVWRHYRVGQCDDKRPSFDWCVAADRAVESVARQEGRSVMLTFQRAFFPNGRPV